MSQWLLVFAILFTVTISLETKDITDLRRYRDLDENTNVDDISKEFQGMKECVKKLSKAIARAELTCLQKEENEGWSSYSLWSECTETCGGGTRTRTRKCTKSSISKGVAACNGCSVQTQACNTTPCPVNGGWSNYGAWTGCTKPCGTGTKTRTRTCTNPSPSDRGSGCKGSAIQSEVCIEKPCPVNGGWSNYGAWTSCTKPCGTGIKTKTRTCTNPSPSEGGAACKGSATQSEACNEKLCPVNGAWSKYGDWTRCTKTCGRGIQTRSRTCTNPSPSAGGSACKGSPVQSKACNENLCPVCPLGWKSYGPSCYFFSQTMVTWNDAKRNCITKNSMLAEVVSYGERNFLRKRASEYAETFWLGGTDSKNEGSWIWATSQSNFIVTGWHTRLVKEPNNQDGNENCNNIHKRLDFEWNDDNCLKRYRYICEKLLV